MKKIILTISLFFALVLPIICSAQFDYLDQMINNDQSIFESSQVPIGEDVTDVAQFTLKSIDVFWSTDSYVPYDYPGRALPAVDGFVDIGLDLELYRGKPENLQYSWFVDNVFYENQSGYGRKNFKLGIRRSAQQTHTVLVKIFDDAGLFYLEKTITIPITKPEIIIYTSIKNPSFSELAKKIIVTPSNKKSYFVAKPFFFSIKKPTDLDYQWQISNQESIYASGLSANILTLTVPEKKSDERESRELLISVGNGWEYPKQNASRKVTLDIR